MNNKTIIEFGFRIIWRIMEISEGVIHLNDNTLLDLHNFSQDTQPHSLIILLNILPLLYLGDKKVYVC